MRQTRRIKTDMDQLTTLYRIHRINNLPKFFNFSPDFQKKTRAIYVERTSPKSFSPEKFKIYKLNTHRNDNSLSPARSWYTLTNKRFNDSNFLFSKNIIPIKNIFDSSFRNYHPKSISEEEYNNITNNRSIIGLKNSLKGPYKQANLSTIKTRRFGSISPSVNSVFNKERDDSQNSNKRYINKINFVKNNKNYLKNNEFNINIEKSMNYTPLKSVPRKLNYNYKINTENIANNRNIGGALNLNKYNSKSFNKRNISNNLNNNSPQNNNNISDINNYSFNQKTKSNNMNNQKYDTPDDNSQFNVLVQPIENIIYTEVYIKPEDLIYLEERLSNIAFVLYNKKNIFDIEVRNECMELYNFYFNSTLCGKFPLFFKENNRLTIQSAFNLNLFVVIISYHLSTNFFMLMKLLNSLHKIYNFLQMNLFLFIRKIQLFYGEEYAMNNEAYFHRANLVLEINNLNDLNEKQIIYVISQNCYNIVEIINYSILDYYYVIGNEYYEDFQEIFLNISNIQEQEIYNYFYNNLLNPKDLKPKLKYYVPYNYNNIINNNILEIQKNENEKLNDLIMEYLRNKESPPFAKSPNTKKFTVVLDIDETLVNVTFDSPDSTNGICKFRPGLIHFLKSIKPYYEIISFTTNSKEYSESIISQIEMGKKIFDYNLSREHSLLCGNQFIKDISRIGRDMRRIIIIDDKANNFKLNKENGILIYPYFGDDDNDTALFELTKLLILFYKIGYSDLRTAIVNYKKEIDEKITKGFEG